MADRRLSGSINLNKLPQAVIKELKGKNGMIRGVFLPIDGNQLTVHENGSIYMDVNVVVRDEEDKYGQHGFISKNVPTQFYKDNKDDKDLMKSVQPILGNLKDFSFSSSKSEDAPVEVGADDDLPF